MLLRLTPNPLDLSILWLSLQIHPVYASHHVAVTVTVVSGGSRWHRRSERCQTGDLGPGGQPNGPGKEHAFGNSAGSAGPCLVGFPEEAKEERGPTHKCLQGLSIKNSKVAALVLLGL